MHLTTSALLKTKKDHNEAFVYIVDMDHFISYLPAFCQYLSSKELIQVSQYRTKILQNYYIISHALLRYILSHYVKLSPKQLQFTTDKYGKPFLNGDYNIKFNMSHSHNMVAYIITCNNINVGIDIELHDPQLDIQALINLVLNHREIITFNNLRLKQQFNTFYHLWTQKEALVKAIGVGLFYPITNIDILSIVQGGKVSITNITGNVKYKLYTYSLKVEGNFSGAIAADRRISKIIHCTNHDIYKMLLSKND